MGAPCRYIVRMEGLVVVMVSLYGDAILAGADGIIQVRWAPARLP